MLVIGFSRYNLLQKVRHLAIVVLVYSVNIGFPVNIDIKFAKLVWSEEVVWKVCYVLSPCTDH